MGLFCLRHRESTWGLRFTGKAWAGEGGGRGRGAEVYLGRTPRAGGMWNWDRPPSPGGHREPNRGRAVQRAKRAVLRSGSCVVETSRGKNRLVGREGGGGQEPGRGAVEAGGLRQRRACVR